MYSIYIMYRTFDTFDMRNKCVKSNPLCVFFISFDTSVMHTSFTVLIVLTVLIGKYINTFLLINFLIFKVLKVIFDH